MARFDEFNRDDTLDSSDEPPMRLVDALLLPLAMAQGISGPGADMASLSNFSGAVTLDSSDDGPLRLVDILLLPVSVVIIAVTFVVTFAYVLLLDRVLALHSMKARRRVKPDIIRLAPPKRDVLTPPRIVAPRSPVLAGSIRG
jgi:hypothetical protein